MGLFSELTDRIKAPTPRFWKRMRNLFISVGSIGTTVYMLPDDVGLPAFFIEYQGTMIAIGLLGTILSQLTKGVEEQPDLIDPKNFNRGTMGSIQHDFEIPSEEDEIQNDPLA